jgi:O-antigen ligase
LKYVILAIALSSLFPFSIWLRTNPQYLPKVWVIIGFLPFGITAIPHLYIAVISWEWPGFVKGAEVSLLDLLLLALYVNLPKARRPLPFRLTMALYFTAVALSVFAAEVPFAALFYLWQLARMFLVYAVVARACQDQRIVDSVLTGMLIGLGYEAIVVIWQRFVLDDLQTPGTLGHQNTLGMLSHFVVFPFFALYLARRTGWKPKVAPLAGLIIAVMTVSRGTIALAGLGYLLTFLISSLRKFSVRKARIAILGAAVLIVAAPFVLISFEKRYNFEPLSETYDERAAFEIAAKQMLSDYPMGIGANNFVVVANSKGYYENAGVASVYGSRSGTVHNAFLLAAAESGYLGVLTFVMMLGNPLYTALRVGWRHREDDRGDLLLGLGVSLLLVYLQSLVEWSFFLFYSQYMFAVVTGLVGGLCLQLRYGRVAKNAAAPYSRLFSPTEMSS